MKALVITAPGGPEVLELQDRDVPEPGLNQIQVRVRASALNRADISQRLGRYPAPPGFPQDISGMEYAGEVVSCGPGASLWNPGDRVMGIIGGGGHAEYVCVNEREALPVPLRLTWEEAAAVPEVFLTAYDAMFLQLGLRAGESLLIHAVGSGVGTAALQLARASGIQAIGTSRSETKLRKAPDLGLRAGVDASTGDWPAKVLTLSGPGGIHAVLDLVGAKYLTGNLQVLSPLGRMIIVGLTAGAKAELDMGIVLRKRLRIMGTALRSRSPEEKMALARDFSVRMLPLFASGKLKAVVDSVHSFSDARAAHSYMESDANFGKIVLRWD
jgi:putative PIG3 family NAD(P)H quinone oxidoreductase